MSGLVKFKCHACGKESHKTTGHYNRAKKLGLNVFCNRSCMGLSRRFNKTMEQRKEEKRQYDIEYRAKNHERLKPKKQAYFQKVYYSDPEKYREIRRRKMAAHVEYCRKPEYKEKKHVYDRARYARQSFGPMWESHVLIMSIGEECEKRMSKYEIRMKNGTLNKSLRRGRNGQVKRGYT